MNNFYDRFWKKTSAELDDFRYKWPKLRNLLPKNTCLLLDYGCGKGKILAEIHKQNPDAVLYGADISKIAINAAKKAVPGAKIFNIDANQRIPVKDNSMDFVLSLDVIEHIYDTDAVFHEFHRMLKKRGIVLISTPYYGFIKNIIIALIGFNIIYEPTSPHIRFYTKNSLLAMLKKHGFSMVKLGYYGRLPLLWRGIYVLAKKCR